MVAPLAGAWIEMYANQPTTFKLGGSLPSRERGLKLLNQLCKVADQDVAPLAGAWIEMI